MKKPPKDVLKIVMEEMAGCETVGAEISTLPVDQQRAWAVARENWPNDRAHDMAKYGIDGVAIINEDMTDMEEAGHGWPRRYVLSNDRGEVLDPRDVNLINKINAVRRNRAAFFSPLLDFIFAGLYRI